MTIDLTRAQKIQIGVFLAIMLTAGYLAYTGTRPAPDLTIASWVENVPVKTNNSTKPITTLTTFFACSDGKLRITEYPASTNLRASFAFDTEFRHKTFTLYHDPLLDIEAISDPYKRVLNFAAYSFVQNSPQGLFGRLSLDADQRKAEKAARDQLMDAITLVDNGAQTGIIQPELYKKVMAALATYKAKPGDPQQDSAKAALARNVVVLAIQYINVLSAKKAEAINQYVATMDKLLRDDQKTKLAAAKINIRPRNRPRVVASAIMGG